MDFGFIGGLQPLTWYSRRLTPGSAPGSLSGVMLQETVCSDGDQTWVSHMQSECLTAHHLLSLAPHSEQERQPRPTAKKGGGEKRGGGWWGGWPQAHAPLQLHVHPLHYQPVSALLRVVQKRGGRSLQETLALYVRNPRCDPQLPTLPNSNNNAFKC